MPLPQTLESNFGYDDDFVIETALRQNLQELRSSRLHTAGKQALIFGVAAVLQGYLGGSVADPDPPDPYVLDLPNPDLLVRGFMDPDPSLFSKKVSSG
jgi:hypothetical protein